MSQRSWLPGGRVMLLGLVAVTGPAAVLTGAMKVAAAETALGRGTDAKCYVDNHRTPHTEQLPTLSAPCRAPGSRTQLAQVVR